MHIVSNIAEPFSNFFPFKKAPKPYLVSENRRHCRARASCPSTRAQQLRLNGSCFSHYFIFIPLSDNRNSQIYQWKLFYWEFSCIKIQYVGTERETNVTINIICPFCMFRRSELACVQKCKQFVSVNCSVQRKRSNENITFETCQVFMLYVEYGFNNNKHTLA